MDQRVDCTPEGMARLYFLDLVGWVRDLQAGRESVCRAFSSLVEEYGTAFPRSRLQLSPKYRPLHGPTALYWAKLRSVRVKSKSGGQEARTVPGHLRGFEKEWAFTIARRSDRCDRLVDFNRRREALNQASRALILALDGLRVLIVRKFPLKKYASVLPSCLDPYTVKEVPEPPVEFFPLGLPSRLSQHLRSGWIAAFTLATAEQEVCELALEVARNPSVEELRIDLSERRRPNLLRSTRWVFSPTGTVYPKLTDRLMRKLPIRRDVRPVLSMKERKRRRLEKELLRSAGSLDAFRKRCEAAQLVASAKLAEAKRALLSNSVQPNDGSPKAAG